MKKIFFALLPGIALVSCNYFSGSSGSSALDTRLKNSMASTEAFNGHLLGLFDRALAGDRAASLPYHERAQAMKKCGDDLCDFLERSKKESAQAQSLAGKIYDFRDNLLKWSASYNKAFLEKLFVCFDTLQFPGKSGDELNRYLTFLQHDVKKCEQCVLQLLYEDMNASYYRFDSVALKAMPGHDKVKQGDYYSAELFLAGFRTTQAPSFVTGSWDWMKNKLTGDIDSTSIQVSRGVGILRQKAEKPGRKKITVVARIKSPFDNSIEELPVEVQYTVVKK